MRPGPAATGTGSRRTETGPVSLPSLEVADIFRDHGPAWRRATKGVSGAGHVSLAQLKVMAAIEACRTAALGGHVAACADCSHTHIAYNSCRNRPTSISGPKCQGVAARDWLERRAADLLPVPYYHVVFTLPAPIADIAWHNKAGVYDLLLRASAETLLTIAVDPKHPDTVQMIDSTIIRAHHCAAGAKEPAPDLIRGGLKKRVLAVQKVASRPKSTSSRTALAYP
jgi:hypothetical protein